ncbi:hypothetical protein BC936DRAFT_148121, partial [Jimgerdemannia flammicorona]
PPNAFRNISCKSKALGPTSPIIRGNPQPARATKTAMTRRKNRCCGLLISQQVNSHNASTTLALPSSSRKWPPVPRKRNSNGYAMPITTIDKTVLVTKPIVCKASAEKVNQGEYDNKRETGDMKRKGKERHQRDARG